jgi:hypothetical protein
MAGKLESDDTVFCDAKLKAVLPITYDHKIKAWLDREE